MEDITRVFEGKAKYFAYGMLRKKSCVIEVVAIKHYHISFSAIKSLNSSVYKPCIPGSFRDEAEAKPFTCLDGRTAQDASRNQLMSSVITSSDPVFYRSVYSDNLNSERI